MKILKKFLLVFCFSIFLFGFTKAKALVNFDTYTNANVENYLNNHSGSTPDDFKDMILSNLDFQQYVEGKYYFVLLDSGIPNRYFVRIFDNETDLQTLQIRLSNETNYKGLSLYYNSNFTYINYNIYFKSNGEFDRIATKDMGTASGLDGITLISNARYSSSYSNYIIDTNIEALTYNYDYSGGNNSFSIDNVEVYNFNDNDIPPNFLNGTTYNFTVSEQNTQPILYVPQIQHFNGYDKVTYYIDNFTIESNQDGYQIMLKNNTNGTIENISPDINNINQIITKEYYENSNIVFGLYKWNQEEEELEEIEEFYVNTNINFNENSDYSIVINSIDNEQKRVNYDYIIKNNTNVKCYYSINGNNEIENEDCTDTHITWSLFMTNNGNVTWYIKDLEDNILYTYTQNFVFNVGQPFISFEDNYNNNFLNLNVLINRYSNNYTIEYYINNSTSITPILEDYSNSQNIKYFVINNLSDNDYIIVNIKENNTIIASANYRVNYIKYTNNSNQNFNIDEFFNKINIENINSELKEYIKNFGNLILNSKIGNLILLEAFCFIIIIILKMIRK